MKSYPKKGNASQKLTAGKASAPAGAALLKAVALHQKGLLREAKAIYEAILKEQPRHADVLHLMGVVAYQTKEFLLAADLIGKAVELNSGNPTFYCNLGNALVELQRAEEAIASYNRAIALKSDYAEAYFNRGNAQRKLKQLEAAIASYNNAIAIKSDFALAHYNLGNVLKESGRFHEALTSYDKAIRLKPDYAEAYSNRGNTLKELKRLDAAIASYDQAIALNPHYADAYSNRGIALQEQKQHEAAIASYSLAIAIQPANAAAYLNRGIAHKELKQFEAAMSDYDRAIAIEPDFAEAYLNRGIAFRESGSAKHAVACYGQAISIRPDYAEAYSNRGNALMSLNQLDEALANYDRAIALMPDYADAYWNKALALLLIGDYARGWPLYEWRWKTEDGSKFLRTYEQPLWLGSESLEGKTILLHSEQGFGDTIQFCRYAKLVAELGAAVLMGVQQPLIGLLRQMDGIELVAEGSELPDFDYHCPLLSLPLAFKTNLATIPSRQAYLHSDPRRLEIWSDRLGKKTKLRIGLVWSGSLEHKNDHNRSMPLSALLPRLSSDYELVSLQRDVRDIDQATLVAHPAIRHFGSELADFTDTAALCELMDVVISVDTSVAHLSAAMGKRTWLLLPFAPDWRWLLSREDSPWYASVRIFRQSQYGEWQDVLEQVSTNLALLACEQTISPA